MSSKGKGGKGNRGGKGSKGGKGGKGGKGSRTSGSNKRSASEALPETYEELLRQSLVRVDTHITSKDVLYLFQHPVTDDIAPGYSTIIENPMDMSTMRQKIKANKYTHVRGYMNDLELMYRNCLRYNQDESEIAMEGRKLYKLGKRYCEHELKRFEDRCERAGFTAMAPEPIVLPKRPKIDGRGRPPTVRIKTSTSNPQVATLCKTPTKRRSSSTIQPRPPPPRVLATSLDPIADWTPDIPAIQRAQQAAQGRLRQQRYPPTMGTVTLDNLPRTMLASQPKPTDNADNTTKTGADNPDTTADNDPDKTTTSLGVFTPFPQLQPERVGLPTHPLAPPPTFPATYTAVVEALASTPAYSLAGPSKARPASPLLHASSGLTDPAVHAYLGRLNAFGQGSGALGRLHAAKRAKHVSAGLFTNELESELQPPKAASEDIERERLSLSHGVIQERLNLMEPCLHALNSALTERRKVTSDIGMANPLPPCKEEQDLAKLIISNLQVLATHASSFDKDKRRKAALADPSNSGASPNPNIGTAAKSTHPSAIPPSHTAPTPGTKPNPSATPTINPSATPSQGALTGTPSATAAAVQPVPAKEGALAGSNPPATTMATTTPSTTVTTPTQPIQRNVISTQPQQHRPQPLSGMPLTHQALATTQSQPTAASTAPSSVTMAALSNLLPVSNPTAPTASFNSPNQPTTTALALSSAPSGLSMATALSTGSTSTLAPSIPPNTFATNQPQAQTLPPKPTVQQPGPTTATTSLLQAAHAATTPSHTSVSHPSAALSAVTAVAAAPHPSSTSRSAMAALASKAQEGTTGQPQPPATIGDAGKNTAGKDFLPSLSQPSPSIANGQPVHTQIPSSIGL
eukprot:m.144760 g.144760  ORF g.144760 m.144760 type:complete len:860 (-) comp16207_c0_seq2:105-2684(-)